MQELGFRFLQETGARPPSKPWISSGKEVQRIIRHFRSYLDKATTRLYADVYLLPARIKAHVGSVLRNDRGGVSLEWVALGFLVLAILFAVATAFN